MRPSGWKRYKDFTGMPITVANSSSNEIAVNSLKNRTAIIIIKTFKATIIYRSKTGIFYFNH
jgi:hypothetical protein